MKKAVVALIGIWYLLAFIAAKPFLPYPHLVLIHLFETLAEGTLLQHFLISSFRIVAATIAAAIPAVMLGLWTGRSPKADKVVSPLAYVMYPIPKVALLPVIMLFLGLGNLSKIFLISLIIFFQLYFVVRDAARAIDKRYLDSVRSLDATRKDLLVHVVIPAVLPSFFTALRISTGTATAVLFLAETFATTSGLGYLIMDSWARMDYLDMYTAMVALSILASLLFGLFSFLDKILCPQNHEAGKI